MKLNLDDKIKVASEDEVMHSVKPRLVKVTVYGDNDSVVVKTKGVCYDMERTLRDMSIVRDKRVNKSPPTRTKEGASKPLKLCAYQRRLTKINDTILRYDIPVKNTYFLTLTVKGDTTYDFVTTEEKKFLRKLRNSFDNIGYFTRIEYADTHCKHFHSHIVLTFHNGVPDKFTEDWLNKKWTYGFHYIEPCYNTEEIVDYLCKFNKDVTNPEMPDCTVFPNYKRLYTHYNYARREVKVRYQTQEEANKTVQDVKDKYFHKTGTRLVPIVKCHRFVDPETGEVCEVCDRYHYVPENKVKED